MLAVSGELNPKAGGIPARPDLNPEVAFSHAKSWVEPHRSMNRPLPGQRNRERLARRKSVV